MTNNLKDVTNNTNDQLIVYELSANIIVGLKLKFIGSCNLIRYTSYFEIMILGKNLCP